jgi:hypothetical protein
MTSAWCAQPRRSATRRSSSSSRPSGTARRSRTSTKCSPGTNYINKLCSSYIFGGRYDPAESDSDLKLFFFSFEDLLKAFEKAKPVIAKEEKGVIPRFYIRYVPSSTRLFYLGPVYCVVFSIFSMQLRFSCLGEGN